ncbi:MAG: ribosome recycling factor [Clostridiales bacterium]|nr:ribosome recycling factor [Clostridiales bacterium]
MLVTQEVQDRTKAEMQKAQETLKKDLLAIRAGRANPQLLDRISFDYYGSMTPLKAAANISAPEPRVLQIIPYDVKAVKEICRAIQASDLGLNPSTDGKIIRLVLPELTEERRKDLTKLVRKTGEQYKTTIRTLRREANEQIKKMKKNSEITEDDQKKTEDAIQKLTDAAIKEVDKICDEKEKEIMEVR